MTSTVDSAGPRERDELVDTIGAAADNLARLISFAINHAKTQGLEINDIQRQLRALVRHEPDTIARLTHATAEKILAVLTASSSEVRTLH